MGVKPIYGERRDLLNGKIIYVAVSNGKSDFYSSYLPCPLK